jgi:UDPglucose 6-dehydrogenase
VDENDVADVDFVMHRITRLFPWINRRAILLISSQVPVGFTQKMESVWLDFYKQDQNLVFVYSPENLRRGQALRTFHDQTRIIIGIDRKCEFYGGYACLSYLFKPFCNQTEWMGTKSAEMTKHALNAFLGMSISFINEIAELCKETGADPNDVARGLKSEGRIGQKAFLTPGGPFTGGTLARDLRYLHQLGKSEGVPTLLLDAAYDSNERHKKRAL